MDDGISIKKMVWTTILLSIAFIAVTMWGAPVYSVWSQGMKGKAELARAEANRKIAVQEAQAKKDSAALLADGEVMRAEGVAKANKIIGDSLAGNEAYLHYLWIQELANSGHVIYVPTEAGLPILEAGGTRFLGDKKEGN